MPAIILSAITRAVSWTLLWVVLFYYENWDNTLSCFVFYFVLWKDLLDKLRWFKYQVLHTFIMFFWNAQVHKAYMSVECSRYSYKMHWFSCQLMLRAFSSNLWPVGEIKMEQFRYKTCLFSSSHLRSTGIWSMLWQVPIWHTVTCWSCFSHCHMWFSVKYCEILFAVLEAPCGTCQCVQCIQDTESFCCAHVYLGK